MSKLKSVLAGMGHRALGLAVGAAMLVSLAAASPVTREPALWVLRDADSTVYLFGTVHLLKSETAWRSPKVERALAESEDVWFELAEAGDDAASAATAAALLPRLGYDAARPLSSRLTAADRKRLAAAEAASSPTSAISTQSSWLSARAAATLGVFHCVPSRRRWTVPNR